MVFVGYKLENKILQPRPSLRKQNASRCLAVWLKCLVAFEPRLSLMFQWVCSSNSFPIGSPPPSPPVKEKCQKGTAPPGGGVPFCVFLNRFKEWQTNRKNTSLQFKRFHVMTHVWPRRFGVHLLRTTWRNCAPCL
jgi:hypothetical protein